MELMDIQEPSEASSTGTLSSDRRKRKRDTVFSSTTACTRDHTATLSSCSDCSIQSHSSKMSKDETCSPPVLSIQSYPSTSASTSGQTNKYSRGLRGRKLKVIAAEGSSKSGYSKPHECVAVIRDKGEPDPSKGVICKLRCHLGDTVSYDSSMMLSSGKAELLRTGRHCVDEAMRQLYTSRSLKTLGILHHGQYSHILLVQSESNHRQYAVKLIHKGTHTCKRSLRTVKPCTETAGNINEVTHVQQLQHPNIISYIDCMVTDFGKTALILEHCAIGKLQSLLDTCYIMSEIVARRYFQQMFSAVSFIHSQGLAVMNICTNHFLLTNSNVIKLVDLSQVVDLYQPLQTNVLYTPGTSGFQSPEISLVQGRSYSPSPCDIWSLAVCLYYMVTGQKPTQCQNIIETAFPLLFSPQSRLSAPLTELLRGMLIHHPGTRYTLNMIRYSDWFKQTSDLPCITGYHLLRQPRKEQPSSQEWCLRDIADI